MESRVTTAGTQGHQWPSRSPLLCTHSSRVAALHGSSGASFLGFGRAILAASMP